MKKRIFLVLSFILCVCMILSGCGNNLKMPTGEISSNGGRVVSIGNYIYYSNTYVDYSTLVSGDNKEGKTEHNSIYRIKTNSYGGLNKTEDGALKDVDKVFGKIAGFNKSNMFVVDEYLFFTSPNVHKDKSGEDRFDLTTLFRIKLDGTGLKEILTTKSSQGEFFLVNGQNPFLLIYDNDCISKITVGKKIGKLETLVSDVESVVFPKEYSNISTLYYTTKISEEDSSAGLSGNYLNKLNLLNNETEIISAKQVSQTITLVAYENNVLYYKKLDNGLTLYYKNAMTGSFEEHPSNNSMFVFNTDGTFRYQFMAKGTMEQLEFADNIAYVYNSKLFINDKQIDSDVTRIDAVNGDYVYYTTNSGMNRVSYIDKEIQNVTTQTSVREGTVEFAGEYVYYYAMIEETESETLYLYRVSVRSLDLNQKTNWECLSLVNETENK